MNCVKQECVELCRICESTENLVDIYSETFNHINYKLNKIVDFTDSSNPRLKFVCLSCCAKVENAYEFKSQCEETYKKLLHQITNKSTDDSDNQCEDNSISPENDQETDEENKIKKYDRSMNFEIEEERKYSDCFEIIDISDENVQINNLLHLEMLPEVVEFLNNRQKRKDNENLNPKNDLKEPFKTTKVNQGKPKRKYVKRKKICSTNQEDEDGKQKNGEQKDGEKKDGDQTDDKGEQKDANEKTTAKKYASNRIYECAFCGKVLKKRQNIWDHINIVHLKKSRYKCDICGIQFRYNTGYYVHRKTHFLPDGSRRVLNDTKACEDILKVSCEICGKCVKRNSLKSHMITHLSKPRPKIIRYVCHICGYTAPAKTQYVQHMNIHSEDKTYKCDKCGKGFAQKVSLVFHMRTHTGEKPFACQVCPKTFVCKAHLRIHTRIHTDERNHKCQVCEKAFRVSTALKLHMRLHTGETPFQCPNCSKKLQLRRSLMYHMKHCTAQKTAE
ncbi:zinc finger protein 37-like [Lutzomyia longipalpis]|uniref:zinc finger protein 37-like n=1 Tax=Lutzomyia longipalpis TaxID=7200 RepID=UPI0024838B09|nr:zinc finger protein 37-like [Lutzomyia longipalpis]